MPVLYESFQSGVHDDRDLFDEEEDEDRAL